jgi:hypothetical protein
MSKHQKREELAKGVRENLIPTLEQLGFESTRKDISEHSDDPMLGHFFRRTRNGYEDEIWIHWDKYGRPRFILEFKTTQEERMSSGNKKAATKIIYGRIYPSHGPLWRILLGGEPSWFGSSRSTKKTVDVARNRVHELDEYLRLGRPMRYIWLG